jgi:hypothetical protein
MVFAALSVVALAHDVIGGVGGEQGDRGGRGGREGTRVGGGATGDGQGYWL